jgi:hypothetical protein
LALRAFASWFSSLFAFSFACPVKFFVEKERIEFNRGLPCGIRRLFLWGGISLCEPAEGGIPLGSFQLALSAIASQPSLKCSPAHLLSALLAPLNSLKKTVQRI